MIKCFVNINQLHNFLDLKEPVLFINNIIGDNFVELNFNLKEVIITEYASCYTIELVTFRKRVKRLWKKLRRN